MRPLIFISNDDGYAATGLNSLIEMVRDLGDVIVVAPDTPRSGASLSFSSTQPLRLKLIKEEEGIRIYSCSGTPCDCVKLGFEMLIDRTPTVVLSGINHGDNASVNAHYSGTMAVALEGTLKKVPSVGLSSCRMAADADFSSIRPYVRNIVKTVMRDGLPDGVYINVNFPDANEFLGVRVCRMGSGEWVNELEKRCDPRGHDYYWVAGRYVDFDADNLETDLACVKAGYVAITPLQLDATAYSVFSSLKNTFEA